MFDIGTTPERSQYITPAIEHLADTNTSILFDDMHKRVILNGLNRVLENYTYKEIGVKGQTLDEYGRYSRLIYAISQTEQTYTYERILVYAEEKINEKL